VDPPVRVLRERQKHNLLATLLLSQSTPMIVAGDEFGRTQLGNNNAYRQDNEISWVDWEGIDEDGLALTEFLFKLTTLRHTLPVLRRGRFLTGEFNDELQLSEVKWMSPAGVSLIPEQWTDSLMRCFGLLIDGRAQESGIRKPASDATLLIVLNAHHDVVEFKLPEIPGSDEWQCLIDSSGSRGIAGIRIWRHLPGHRPLIAVVRASREGPDATHLCEARKAID
jgi:isoamylase